MLYQREIDDSVLIQFIILFTLNNADAALPYNQIFEITQKGAVAGEFFAVHIPVYIREPILESIKNLYIEERRKNAIKSDITPVRKNEYNSEFHLFDDDKTEIMGLSLYAGSREEAERMAVYFKENSAKVYEKIIEALADTD